MTGMPKILCITGLPYEFHMTSTLFIGRASKDNERCS